MMTLEELTEHTENLKDLLRLKHHQLAHLKIDSTARARHEFAIHALEDRVRELRRSVDVLRGDLPTLEIKCVRPCRPPLVDMIRKTKPVGDLPAAPRKIGA